MKKGDVIQIKIDTLAFGGAGIGRYTQDGASDMPKRQIPVFVHDTVPGDMVEVSLTKIKTNFLEANLVSVVESSPDRITPRCKHFGVCGGCTWQFLPYEKQVQYKESQVRECLEHIGGFVNPPLLPIIACEEPWSYRNKMELSFGSELNGETTLGFHVRGMRYDIFDLEECFLQSDFLTNFVPKFSAFVKSKGWKAYHTKLRTGFLKSLVVREGKNTGERMINLVTIDNEFDEQKEKEFLAFLLEEKFVLSSVFHTHIVQAKGHRTELIEHVLHGNSTLCEELILKDETRLSFDIAPQAFFQPNTLQAQKLYQQVLEFADLKADDLVFDLYCGTGTIGLFCAKKTKYVIGIELNTDALESAIQNAKKNGISNVEFFCGNVEELVRTVTRTPTCVIVDPPRFGLGEKTVHEIVALGADKIISVSCNPSTFARDAAMLCRLGYVLKRVVPVDMFPQTYHIETVAEFAKVS